MDLVIAVLAAVGMGPGIRPAPAGIPVPTQDGAAAFAMDTVVSEVRWSPITIVEGTLFSIEVEGRGPGIESVTGTFEGEPLHFERRVDGIFSAMAAAPLDSVGTRLLRLEVSGRDGSTEEVRRDVLVDPGTYAMQRLSVAPEFGTPPPPAVQRRIEDESARAFEIARRSHETSRLWEGEFSLPRDSRITSGFGHGRTFNGQVQSRHTGTDFAGAVGAPVLAPARGRVALVDDFYLGGGVIYLDHGAGLVTGYLHLSEQLVEEGQIVEQGQTIAWVGATGRVTGPHLHWIVRYGPHSVDGMSLLRLSPSR